MLLARAAPVFEQAALAAQEQGLHALVHTRGNPPELCLEVSREEHGYSSHYRIRFDSATSQVLHQLYFANDGSTRAIDGADHSLSSERCQQAYTSILTSWISEMIIGDRIGHLS